jgi:hypothetical protein
VFAPRRQSFDFALTATQPRQGGLFHTEMRSFSFPRRLIALTALAAAAVPLLLAPGAQANPDIKKAIWGPSDSTAFSHYSDLNTGSYQILLDWRWAAPTKPANPRDPNDPAYRWASRLEDAVSRAKARGIQVSMLVQLTPSWATSSGLARQAPNPNDYADFIHAASRHFPYVKYWQIWGEPSRSNSFIPMHVVHSGRQLTDAEKKPIRLYARVLNHAYWAIKGLNKDDQVIGGNTLTHGDIRPLRFIQAMRLPNGKPPHMDLYGHNPYSPRKPDLSKTPKAYGTADFSDLDTLGHWIDRYLGRKPNGKKIRIFVAEYNLCTDHANHLFYWWGNKQDQAAYARAALRITRSFHRIYTMGWFRLDDEAPRSDGQEANFGLLTYGGATKPAYFAYKNN